MAMIGVFIGSFNPITQGHVYIAESILQHTECTHVMFVPVSDFYGKASLKVEDDHRVQMIRLAISGYENMSVNTIEIEMAEQLGRQNKTIETMCELRKQYDEPLVFIIGADNVAKLHTWYKAEELVSEFGVFVISRDGIDVEKLIQEDEWLNKNISYYDVVDEAVNSASSSEIRENVKQGLSIDGLVCEMVKQYIYEHQLYVEECV